jgi:hypothetical protein
LDPLELSFEFKQDAVFRDIETGEEINTQPWHIRQDYQTQVKEFIDYYKKGCRENQIDHVTISSHESYDRALIEYLLKRKRIGG